MDCDDAGHHLAEIIGSTGRQPGCRDVSFRVDLPPKKGYDWNDVLKHRNAHSLPAARMQFPLSAKPPGF